jgi:hypothetical protein
LKNIVDLKEKRMNPKKKSFAQEDKDDNKDENKEVKEGAQITNDT